LKLVSGVGTNDAGYPVTKKVKGKIVWKCPFYRKWENMLYRVYKAKGRPNYSCCTVCEEWFTFSNFKSWMEKQDWEGNDIDKDILVKGNKVYCPENCRFVPPQVNYFILDKNTSGYMSGVKWNPHSKCYTASCSDPFSKKVISLGYYSDELTAHLVWKEFKLSLAQRLSLKYTLPNEVIEALLLRYKFTDDEAEYLNVNKLKTKISKRYRIE